MEDQMTPLSELGLTDPQQQQDELAAQLAIILHLLKAGGGGLSSLNQNTGPVVTQDMIDALSANAPERQGLVPPQTPAGVQTKPGVMTQLGAQISPRPSDAEFMVPQAGGDLVSLLSGGGESQVPGAITSYAGTTPTTYVPETPQRPQVQSQQANQPETGGDNLGLTDAERQAAIQGYLSRGEPVPDVLKGTTPTVPTQGKPATQAPATSTTTMSPQEQQQVATYSALLEKNKVPADVRSMMIEKQFPKVKAQREAEKKDLFEFQKKMQHDLSPAKPGIYLNSKGEPISTPLIMGNIPEGTTFYQAGSPQAKVYGANGQVNIHIDRTLDHLNAISKIDSSRFQRYLTTQLKYFNNDPDIVALKNFLSPASAGAVMNGYAATSVAMRGGANLIQIYRDAVYTEGDDLRSVLTKLKDLEIINIKGAEHTGLHSSVIKADQDRLDQINKLLGEVNKANKTQAKAGAQTQNPTPMNIPPGQAPVINPQGKLVTIPLTDLQEALKPENGYKPYQP